MKKSIITMTLILAATAATAAEERAAATLTPPTAVEEPAVPSPDDMKQIMEMSLGAMVPMMGKMAEVTIEAQLQVARKPETAKSVAVFKKNLYTELVAQGFSKAEALQIVLNTPLPSGMPGMK